jgi:ceramide glucosyltransferase
VGMNYLLFTTGLRWLILVLACGPLVYYVLSIVCAWDFFSERPEQPDLPSYAPPISVLKPARGLDREAYENYASFCRQDYPEYEVLFAVSDADDPAIPVIERVIRDHPERPLRLLIGAPPLGTSSKVNKLCRLVQEARYGLLAISDSDVRVEPGYLRQVAAPFRDPLVGAVTALFRGNVSGGILSHLAGMGAGEDFSGTLIARRFEGMKFLLGTTMATTRERLAEIGGFEALVSRHADDFELGSRIAGRGYRVELLREPVWMVFPEQSLGAFLRHELRWMIGLRNIRPMGHLGMIFTHGLPWALAAAAVAHSWWLAALFLTVYLALRLAMAWTISVWGLRDPVVRRNFWLIPLRDALTVLVWLASFASNRVQWRGLEFTIEKDILAPVPSSANPSARG